MSPVGAMIRPTAVDQRLFTEMAALEGTHWWFLGRGEIVCALVQRECEARGGRVSRLVDVGPGTGAILGRLAGLADEAVGIEPDATALAIARGRGLDVRSGPADALPFEDGSVDVVTAFDVLEHLEDDVAAAHEFRRVLRPGGAAILTVPAYRWLWSRHDDLHGHVRRYTRATLTAMLRRGGLGVVRCGYFMTFLFPLAVAERLAARLLRRPTHDLALPPRSVNALLLKALLAERGRVAEANGYPFGLTVFAVATAGEAP